MTDSVAGALVAKSRMSITNSGLRVTGTRNSMSYWLFCPKNFFRKMARRPPSKNASSSKTTPQSTDIAQTTPPKVRAPDGIEGQLRTRMGDPKNRISTEQRENLKSNADILAKNDYRVITVARFLSAIHESHGIEGVSYDAMARLIVDFFGAGTTGRNLLNFACRDTRKLSNANEFAACLFLIHSYWDEFIAPSPAKAPRQFIELEHELQLTNLYPAMINNDMAGFRDYFYNNIEVNKLYRAFENEMITILGITSDNRDRVKALLLGNKIERTFVVYRETSEDKDKILTCKILIKNENGGAFLKFQSYGFSETIDKIEAVGVVIPMGDVIYFAGHREDYTSLKIYAFPANYSNRLAEGFRGLLLSVDTLGSEPVFSTRVYVEEFRESAKAPALLTRNNVDPEILDAITNSLPFVSINNVYDEKSIRITSFVTLQNKIDASIDGIERNWKIRDKSGTVVNPLSGNVVSAAGVLTAISRWAFVKRKESGGTEQ